MTVSPSAFDGPLSPYRVIDLTDARGLLAGHLLALLGADVIQVEPLQGSCARRTGPFDLRGGESLFWAAFASGKRGVALAYDQRDGLSQLLELIRGADILIESHDPGRMDAMGLGRATLKEINPRLVQVSITGFGSTGPKAHYATSDLILWAAAGTMWPHRGQDGVPLRMSVPQAFHQAAIDAAGGALIALLARGDNGEGQHVDVSAQRSCMLCTLSSHLATAVNHVNFNPLGGVQSDKLLALSGSSARTRKTKWKLRDGLAEMHIGMGAAAGRYSNALFAWLDSLNGPRVEYAEWDWTKVPERLLNGDLVAGDIIDARAYAEKHLANFTKAEILVISQERGLLMAPVMTTKDLLESPQLAARTISRRSAKVIKCSVCPIPSVRAAPPKPFRFALHLGLASITAKCWRR